MGTTRAVIVVCDENSLTPKSFYDACLLAQSASEDATGFAKLADGYNGRRPDGGFIDNQNDANIIINCLDWPELRSNNEIRAAGRNFAKAAPVFGPYVAYSGITCNLLKATIKSTQPRPDSKQESQPKIKKTVTPILIIGTTQDPATPYVWAKALSKYIPGSRLITLQGEGHTGYGRGSACTDNAVDSYLLQNPLPLNGKLCKT